MPSPRHALISGASTGIGRACAIHLAQRGWTVFAGVRKHSDGDALRAAATAGIVPVLMDVTDQHSIAAAVARVADAVGSAGLAGLVNNAGISINGPVEAVPIEEWRRQFDVNFFGHIAVTQAALGLLRQYAAAAAGPSPARIVMMSSIAGRFSQPVLGPYCSSKFALEALSDALRRELRAQRIGVSIIQPGAIQSEIWRKAHEEVASKNGSDPALEPYDYLINGVTVAATQAEHVAIPALRVARVVERCLTAPRPPIRILVGPDAKLMATAKAILPTRALDALLEAGLRRIARKGIKASP